MRRSRLAIARYILSTPPAARLAATNCTRTITRFISIRALSNDVSVPHLRRKKPPGLRPLAQHIESWKKEGLTLDTLRYDATGLAPQETNQTPFLRAASGDVGVRGCDLGGGLRLGRFLLADPRVDQAENDDHRQREREQCCAVEQELTEA